MGRNASDRKVLWFMSIFSICILFFTLRKPPIKDWLLAYLFNAYTNGIIDKYVVSKKYVSYPVRFLPKLSDINILFDYLFYPTASLLANQVTSRDKGVLLFVKMIVITFIMFRIESWAERRTRLVKWQKGWTGYHSFASLTIKSLLNRYIIEAIRKVDYKQQKEFLNKNSQ
ncbi:CBO0543 family protein [Bacillus infantis]|uniref:CBO0543 family protein n=1 Tax=Bacillus infantis TaxID=324767 RepID=UPI003CE7C5B1